MRALWFMAGLFLRVQMGKRRLLWLAALWLAPAALALWWRIYEGGAPERFLEHLAMAVLLQFFSLGLALYFGVSAVRDEIEDRTIVYLLVRPVSRWAVLGGKILAAALLVAIWLVVAAAVGHLVAWVGGEEGFSVFLVRLARHALVLAAAGLVYSGLFALFGVIFEKPFIPAVIFAMGWEATVTNLPGGLPKITIMYYLKSLLGVQPQGDGVLSVLLPPVGPVSPWSALVVLGAAALVLYGAAFWLAGRREWKL